MFMVLNFILKILFMYKKLKNTQGMPKNNYVLCMVHKSPYLLLILLQIYQLLLFFNYKEKNKKSGRSFF